MNNNRIKATGISRAGNGNVLLRLENGHDIWLPGPTADLLGIQAGEAYQLTATPVADAGTADVAASEAGELDTADSSLSEAGGGADNGEAANGEAAGQEAGNERRDARSGRKGRVAA